MSALTVSQNPEQSWDDLVRFWEEMEWPEGSKVEIIEGIVTVSPAPAYRHLPRRRRPGGTFDTRPPESPPACGRAQCAGTGSRRAATRAARDPNTVITTTPRIASTPIPTVPGQPAERKATAPSVLPMLEPM